MNFKVTINGGDIFFFVLLVLSLSSIIDESAILILKIWLITIVFRLVVYLIEKYFMKTNKEVKHE